MKRNLEKIKEIISNPHEIKKTNMPNLLKNFFDKYIKISHIEKYIGDYPTFIEPVYLEENIKIGDDVLLGPNVYIGANSEIGDYVEISNTIIFEDVIIGDNFNLENCIIANNTQLSFSNYRIKDCILRGLANSERELEKFEF